MTGVNKIIKIVCTILFAGFFAGCNSTQKSETGKWSPGFGGMKWSDAKKKCESSGIRLPTIEELKTAHAAGATKTWDKNPNVYWSSTPDDKKYVGFGIVSGSNYFDNPESKNNVRCISDGAGSN